MITRELLPSRVAGGYPMDLCARSGRWRDSIGSSVVCYGIRSCRWIKMGKQEDDGCRIGGPRDGCICLSPSGSAVVIIANGRCEDYTAQEETVR